MHVTRAIVHDLCQTNSVRPTHVRTVFTHTATSRSLRSRREGFCVFLFRVFVVGRVSCFFFVDEPRTFFVDEHPTYIFVKRFRVCVRRKIRNGQSLLFFCKSYQCSPCSVQLFAFVASC